MTRLLTEETEVVAGTGVAAATEIGVEVAANKLAEYVRISHDRFHDISMTQTYMIIQHPISIYVKPTYFFLLEEMGARTGAAAKKGLASRVIDGGGGIDLIGGLRHEAFLNEGTDSRDVGVTEGGGLVEGAEDSRDDLLDVEGLDIRENVVDSFVWVSLVHKIS